MIERKLTTQDVKKAIKDIAPEHGFGRVFGIPKGGYYIAYLIESMSLGRVVDDPAVADSIVDDIIDSGETVEKWKKRFPHNHIYVPFSKIDPNIWYVFPWEGHKEIKGREIVTRILEYIGEDPKREGLVETPDRVVRAWKELYGGYEQNPKEVLGKIFKTHCDEMVICKDIEYYSTCEHHLITFYGKAHIGYLPKGHVVGLSKLARLVDVFAKRLQIQEEMTYQIAKAIMENIPNCGGVGVVVEGKHLCMCGRGVAKQNSIMKTSALLGAFQDHATRSEFFHLID